jgi:hypothetical protein
MAPVGALAHTAAMHYRANSKALDESSGGMVGATDLRRSSGFGAA